MKAHQLLKILLLSGLFLLSLSFKGLDKPEPETQGELQNYSACSIKNNAFNSGEEITYTIYYNWNFVWIPAGEVTFKVNDAGGQYHVMAGGQTFKSYEWMYAVKDKFETYLDKTTLLPQASVRDIKEGKYTLYERTDFDQPKRKAFSLKGKNRQNANKRKDFALDDCMHDILSIVYYIRNVDYTSMKKGQHIPIKVFLDGEVFPLKVTYRGKGNTNVKDLGKFKTVQMSPELVSGNVFKDGDRMDIWATDDANRIPLVIESPIQVGTVKCVLKSYKNLRNPVTSKL